MHERCFAVEGWGCSGRQLVEVKHPLRLPDRAGGAVTASIVTGSGGPEKECERCKQEPRCHVGALIRNKFNYFSPHDQTVENAAVAWAYVLCGCSLQVLGFSFCYKYVNRTKMFR